MEAVLFLKQNVVIMGILGFMSFFALYFSIERVLFYSLIDTKHYKSAKELRTKKTEPL